MAASQIANGRKRWMLLVALLLPSTSLLTSQVTSIASNPSTSQDQKLKPFTVADSIESTHFVVPEEHTSEHPPVSPDGKRFFVVTERGILKSNLREYRLLLFDFAHLGKQPREVAVLRTSSNRPGIDRPKWISSQTISFIGENPNQFPQVYVVNCESRKIRKLTSAARGVFGYDVTKDLETVAYYTKSTPDKAEIKFKEEHGFAVTDENVQDLVMGKWKVGNDVYQMALLNPKSGRLRTIHAPPFSSGLSDLKIWLSPDGRYAVTCQPSFFIPVDWTLYEKRWIKNTAQLELGQQHRIRTTTLHQFMLVDTATGQMRPLLNAPTVGNPAVVWMPDGRSVVVEPTLLPLNTSDHEELERRRKRGAAVDVSVPKISFRRVAEVSEQEFWEQLRSSKTPGTIVVDLNKAQPGGSWKPDVKRAYRRDGQGWVEDTAYRDVDPGSKITISEATNRWPKLVEVEPATQQENVILDPNPQFKNIRFGREEIVRWTGNLGQPLVGGLLYPPNYTPGTRYPLVIQTYQLDENGFLLDGPSTTAYAAQALVNHNVFVLQLSQSPLYYQTILTPDFGRTELSQIDSAVEYLDRLGFIDPEHVGLVGFSMKGFQVTYALAHSNHRFAAATSAEGNDWSYWSYVLEGNWPSLLQQNESLFGGPPWNGNWKPWMQESLTFNYDKIHTPLRIEADTSEFGLVLNEWENFVALKRLHKPVELIYEFNGFHPVVKPFDRMTSQQGNVDWLMFWLKGEEDQDPAKAPQYARWRELKKLQEAQKD